MGYAPTEEEARKIDEFKHKSGRKTAQERLDDATKHK